MGNSMKSPKNYSTFHKELPQTKKKQIVDQLFNVSDKNFPKCLFWKVLIRCFMRFGTTCRI